MTEQKYIVCAKCHRTLALTGMNAEDIQGARYLHCSVCNDTRGMAYFPKRNNFSHSESIGDIGIIRAPLRGMA